MPCASFFALSGTFLVIGDIREVAFGNGTCAPLTSTLNLLSTLLTTKSFSFNDQSSQFYYRHNIKGTHGRTAIAMLPNVPTQHQAHRGHSPVKPSLTGTSPAEVCPLNTNYKSIINSINDLAFFVCEYF